MCTTKTIFERFNVTSGNRKEGKEKRVRVSEVYIKKEKSLCQAAVSGHTIITITYVICCAGFVNE